MKRTNWSLYQEMDVIKKSFFALFILGVFAAPRNCFAQQKQAAPGNRQALFYFDKPITLDSLTKYVHSRSKIRFSFNSSKVKGDKVIDLKKGRYTIETLLQQIQQKTSLYYSMYNGYIIFQDRPPKPKTNLLAVAKKNTIPTPVRNTTTGSQRKPVTIPQKQKNREQPAAIAKHQPVIKEPAADSSKIPAPSLPVNLNQPVAVDSNAVADTTRTGNTPVAQKSNTPASPPSASSTKKAGGRLHLQYGVQWQGTWPVYGFQRYFTGTNNRNQPYMPLIPGIWVSNVFNKRHEVLLMVKPVEWYFYNYKEFRNDTVLRLADSIKMQRSNRLLKTSGIYAGIQYNYHITENWMVGAGIYYHGSRQALVSMQTKRLSDGMQPSDSLYAASTDTLTKYLASSFITGKLEVAYSFGAIDLGVTGFIPITSVFASQSPNRSHPMNIQIFVRWRIKRHEDD